VDDRVVQELLHQHVHGVVERGREQQPLRAAGVAARIFFTPGRKPMSLMWSASSMTVTSTALRSGGPGRAGRAGGRGGDEDVDAAAQRAHLRVLVDAAEDRQQRQPGRLGQRTSDSAIWAASSRVGASISARGRPCGRARPGCGRSRATTGSAKAKVLPEPVRPRPSTSRPASESGSVAAWIGVGV
jgi:hypothetical protein